MGLGRVFLRTVSRRTVAFEEESGRPVWQAEVPGSPTLLHGDALLVERAGGLLALLDSHNGRLRRRLEGLRSGANAVSIGSRIVYGSNSGPWCYDVAEDRVVWQPERQRRAEQAGVFGVGDGTIVTGEPNGAVHGISLESGMTRWTTTVADLARPAPGFTRPGEVSGAFAILEDSTVFEVGSRHVVRLGLRRGERHWSWTAPCSIEGGVLDGSAYHVLLSDGSVSVLSAAGAVEAQYSLQRAVRRSLHGVDVAPPFLVSEGHYWVGSRQGYLMAFERNRGQLAWAHRPEGAATTEIAGSVFVVSGHLLLYSDFSGQVYCLGDQRAVPGPA